jgi:hypothetical protein
MPILGTLASSVQKLSASYESIATVAGGGSSITFNSIPQTYQHLQLRMVVRDSRSTSGATLYWIRINSFGDGAYTFHSLFGNGSTASSSNVTPNWNQSPAGWSPYSTNASGIHGTAILDILDYTDTNKTKVFRTLTGYDTNGAGTVGLYSGMCLTNDAITSITINPGLGPFEGTSHFALYGIKG